jgi:hypothetical protein
VTSGAAETPTFVKYQKRWTVEMLLILVLLALATAWGNAPLRYLSGLLAAIVLLALVARFVLAYQRRAKTPGDGS